jgi:cytoskeletal protein CcmA (bactofilin family)
MILAFPSLRASAMAEPPRRRLLDRFNAPPTVLGRLSVFTGDIQSAGPLTLSGMLDGNGSVDGLLTISREARWCGDVKAGDAIIAGHLKGNLTVAGKLEIGASAVIQGRITAGSIAIARGASVDGEMQVVGNGPIVEFDEHRHED